VTQEFFGLIRDFEAGARTKPRVGMSLRAQDDVLRFGQAAHVHCPADTLLAPSDGPVPQVAVMFMGLLGPMGPMPLHFTEIAIFERRYVVDKAFGAFLDILNNRMVQLFYRAWAASDPMANRDRPDDDRFFHYVAALGSLTGAGAALPSGLEALAGYAGQIAGRRSASSIADTAAALLGTPVEVEEFAGTWNDIATGDRSRLGAVLGKHASLGRDTVAGSRVYTVQDAALLRLNFETLAAYEGFLPDAPDYVVLLRTGRALMPSVLDWRFAFSLARPAVLGRSGKLGWTAWMAPDGSSPQRRCDLRLSPAA
jgi:type VI secretion system ImpH/TssG family protein